MPGAPTDTNTMNQNTHLTSGSSGKILPLLPSGAAAAALRRLSGCPATAHTISLAAAGAKKAGRRS